jgi:hypothetical protein
LFDWADRSRDHDSPTPDSLRPWLAADSSMPVSSNSVPSAEKCLVDSSAYTCFCASTVATIELDSLNRQPFRAERVERTFAVAGKTRIAGIAGTDQFTCNTAEG